MRRFLQRCPVTMWLFATALVAVPGESRSQEVALSADEFKKLDTYEAVALAKADAIFARKDYRSSRAEYDAFTLSFPESPALAYARLRTARSLHLDNKRFEAIKAYQQVLDYSPDEVSYAAAALYYIGECHAQNDSIKPAMKAWAELAANGEYRKHFLAGFALNRLADNLLVQERAAEAVEYFKQTAVDFRQLNREASRYATEKVIYFYIRMSPDEPKLKSFYSKMKTFEEKPGPESDDNYWGRVRAYVRAHGDFGKEPKEKEAQARYYGYWAKVMEGKRAEDDEFQIDQAAFRLYSDGNEKKWMERLDQVFSLRQKEGDYRRIIKWVSVCRAHKKKVEEYYSKLNFARMKIGDIRELMRVMFDDVGDVAAAKTVFARIILDQLSEKEKIELAQYLEGKDGEGVMMEKVCASFPDFELGRFTLLAYYARLTPCPYAKAMALADEVTGFPEYSRKAYWIEGGLLRGQKKFQEAIDAYHSCDDPPRTLWAIVDCHLAMGRRDDALEQLKEIERYFPPEAPEAALRTAFVWRDAGDEAHYIAALHAIMDKYPDSAQSTTGHTELERLGVRIRGGVPDAVKR